jgi:hypothetical protein
MMAEIDLEGLRKDIADKVGRIPLSVVMASDGETIEVTYKATPHLSTQQEGLTRIVVLRKTGKKTALKYAH